MTDPRFSFLESVTSGGEAATALVGGTSIRIIAGKDATGTAAGQVLLYQVATLLARLFDRVELVGNARVHARVHLPGLKGPFLPALRALLPTLRPAGEPTPEVDKVTVVVGQAAEQGHIYLGSSAWCAAFSLREPQAVTDTATPLGALAAGALGAAETFKLVFGDHLRGAVHAERYGLSLLDYGFGEGPEPELPDTIKLDATLYGCGSIGCGFLLGLLATPHLDGTVTVVDNGRFDDGNPYKYALLDQAAAHAKRDKAPWAARLLNDRAHGRITAHSFTGTADQYVASLPVDYRLPVALSAVDTVLARWQIQDTLPQRIINAGITGTTSEVSVHGFGDGPCLACVGLQTELEAWDVKPIADATGLSPGRVYELIRANERLAEGDLEKMRSSGRLNPDSLSRLDSYLGQPLLSLWNRVAYSQASVEISGSPPVQVTTAFVSAFAGVLLLAELIKMATPDLQRFVVGNSYRHDLLGVPAQDLQAYVRDPRGWCLCHSTFRQQIYREKYGSRA